MLNVILTVALAISIVLVLYFYWKCLKTNKKGDIKSFFTSIFVLMFFLAIAVCKLMYEG